MKSEIVYIFGRGYSRAYVASSISLALICLFYPFTIGSYFQVKIYPLIDRVTYYSTYNFFITNEYADHIIVSSLLILWLGFSVRVSKIKYLMIALLSIGLGISAINNYGSVLTGLALSAFPVTIILWIINGSMPKKRILETAFIGKHTLNLTINYLAVIGIIVGIANFGFVISDIITISQPNSGKDSSGISMQQPSQIHGYAYEIFLLFSSFSPLLLLIIISGYPVKLLIDFVSTRIKERRKQEYNRDFAEEHRVITTRSKIIFLSLSIVLSIAMAIIPHTAIVNKDNQSIGVDTSYYVTWINALNNSTDSGDYLYQAFVQQKGGDRPVSLILFAVVQKVANIDLPSAIEYLPIILGPALVLTVFLLTRELLSGNDILPLLAAFMTAISFQVLIGIYSGFYANWLSLIFGYSGFIFFFRFLKKGRWNDLILYSLLLFLTLFSHVYTWSILAIVTGIFLILTLARSHHYAIIDRRRTMLLLIILLASVATDAARTAITGSYGGIGRDVDLAETYAGPHQFILRWSNLTYTTTAYVGGIFGNFLILFLALFWLFKAKMRDLSTLFIMVFLTIGLLPFLFGEWVLQTRVFYNIPFQIPAAIALLQIGKQPRGWIRVLAICIWLVVVATITISNFYLVLPDSRQP